VHPPGRIGAAIRLFQHQMRSAYLRAVLQGGPRYDLEGNPCGEVTPKEQDQARRELQAFYEKRRKSAAPGAAASPGDSPAPG
jgi:ProP effector